jgi:hypothetical protein
MGQGRNRPLFLGFFLGQPLRSDLVWRPGLEVWVSAEDVPASFLGDIFEAVRPPFEPPPLPMASIKPPPLPRKSQLPPPLLKGSFASRKAVEVQTAQTSSAHKKDQAIETDVEDHARFGKKGRWQNYFARHWRGELPLYVSYWFNGTGGYILVTVIVTILSATTTLKDEFTPTWALLSLLLIWSITAAAVSWQLVGTWKSASRYQNRNGRIYWGTVAKVTLTLAALRTLGAFAYTGIPQIGEYYQIYTGDNKVGKHHFRVMRDGQELEFSGGITFGSAKDFAQFINAMGGLKTVHLNSVGGRSREAQRIGDLIKARGLDTYVIGKCLSACTIIFLSGGNRLVAPDAKIGFHQPYFPGLTADERNQVIVAEELRLRQLGVSTEFAKRANVAAANDMWFPPASELIKEKVATRIVDPSNYAFSGVDISELTPAWADKFLRGIDNYEAIGHVNSEAYEKMRAEFLEGLQRGITTAEMRSRIAPIADEVFMDVLPQASAELLIEYARLTAEQLDYLRQRNSRDCYFYANPNKGSDIGGQEIIAKYPSLDEKERAFRIKILRSHHPNAIASSDKKYGDAALEAVFRALRRRYGAEADLIGEDKISPDKYPTYCAVLLAFYEEIGHLPSSSGAAALRAILTNS